MTACIDGYRERYVTASLTETTVAPGIPEALDALDGRRKAVATSKPKAFADPLLEAMGLAAHFEVVAGPDLNARAEDKTETLGRALHELGPTRAVMVGDRSFDILAAHAHGLPAIGVTWGIGTHEGAPRRRRRADHRSSGRPRGDRSRPARRLVSANVLADFSLYNLSLWLHITSAVVGLGATFALAVGFPLALRLDAEVHAVRAPPEPGGHPQARLARAGAADHHRHLPGREDPTRWTSPGSASRS